MESSISRKFKDIAIYSPTEKTAISVRDGVIEYIGSELMMEPYDKIFTVYRSPATIANAAVKMLGIPLTDSHVNLDEPAPITGSTVEDAYMIDSIDECTRTRVAVKNKLSMSDEYTVRLHDKTQLSLGYFGDLIPHEEFDFEQINIMPHHLAAVSAGRCGNLCSFLDRKPNLNKEQNNMKQKVHKVFADEEGQVSLEQVVEIASALPDAIKMLSLEDLQKIMPALQEIIAMAKVGETPAEGEIPSEDEVPAEGEKDKEITDEETPAENEEEKPKFSDADFKVALEEKSKKFADEAVKKYAQVVDKARNFLDEAYDFKDKTSEQIMKDALSTESTDKFSDSELPLAFKLLKKTAEYRKFGDNKTTHPLDEIANKEL